MSAITETEPGCEMVCIVDFSARPRDSHNRSLPGPRRDFRVGEHVRLVAAFFKDIPADNPTGYMAIFEPLNIEDHCQYAATQDYFVSLDCWDGLERFFRSRVSGTHDCGAQVKATRPPRPNVRRVRP
jgi:hypothetical protein